MAHRGKRSPTTREAITRNSQSTLININMANIPKLTSTNYLIWSHEVYALLDGYDLAGYLDGSTVIPPATVTVNNTNYVIPDFRIWKRQDKLIYDALIGAISIPFQPLLSRATTAAQIWQTLAYLYAKASRVHIKQSKTQRQKRKKGNKSTDEVENFNQEATHHIINDLTNLPLHQPYNGSGIPISHTGSTSQPSLSLNLALNNQNRRRKKMESRDVDWSEMSSDALQLILESLSFPNFHRARTVCSSWYSVSKSSVAGSRNRYPWLILFPEKSSVSGSCTLFDPVEDKTYKTRDLGSEFSECRCLASYGNWLLMLSPCIDFYVLNVFTGERINLPSLSLQRGKVRFRRKDDGGVFLEHSPKDRETIINRFIKTAVLWIDEKTKDFVVCWIYHNQYLFSYKKGDDSWWHLEGTKCSAMAYKNKKLCVYIWFDFIKILDFSNDFPNEIIEENPYLNHRFSYIPEHRESWGERVAITTSGDVLIIVSIKKKSIKNQKKAYLFKIFKMNVKGTEWERVESLGDEMLVFGDGFIKSNSIYFVSADLWNPLFHRTLPSSTGVYNLATTKNSWSRFAYCLSNIRWFVPGSDNK